MKRKVCVVLIAALTAAAGFTQGLKFDGYVNSGLGLWYTDAEGKTNPRVMAYGVDSERYIGRFRLNGAYTNEEKTAGANFRLQVQGRGQANEAANTPSLAFGYGWIKVFDMITIKAGLVDDSTWQTADVIYNDDQGEGAGILVRITPLTGLDIGAGAYAASYQSGSNNNFLSIGALPTQVDWNEIKYTFNAAYTMDKVFRLMVSVRSWNKTGGDSAAATPHALAEFRLLMVDNLTAIVVAEADNLDKDFSDAGLINFYETVGYKMGDLSFGLNAAQYFNQAKNTDTAFRFNPWASYALNEGKMVPRLDVVYFMGGYIDGENYHRRGLKANYNKDAYVLNARPSIKFNIDPKTVFEIGDSFYYSKAGKGADSVLTNVFYTDLVIKF